MLTLNTPLGMSLRSPKARAVFDYYVDGFIGSDSNAGTSEFAPFATPAAASAVLASGESVGIRAGAVYTSSINRPDLDGVTVDAYGSGARPIIDCAEIVGTWVAGAQPNTWKVTGIVLPAGASTCHVNVTEDGNLMQGVASEVLCSAAAGSRYATGNTGTIDIYIHTSDGSDPNSNGKVYAYTHRESSITLRHMATVRGIDTRNPRNNNGSIVVGDYSLVEDCAAINGGKHSILAGFGSTVRENDIFEAHNSAESGIQVVIYSSTGPGAGDSYVTGNNFKMRGLLASVSNQSAVYAHTSSGTGGTNLLVTSNTFVDYFGSPCAGAANISGNVRFDDNYITLSQPYTTMPWQFPNPYITANGPGGGMSRNKLHFPEPFATTFTATYALFTATSARVCDDNEYYTGPYFTYLINSTSGSPDITARNNKGSCGAGAFIRLESATANTITECSGNVVGVTGRPIDMFNTSTITLCDNNHWPGASGFRKAGTSYTWAQWTALGFDVSSDAAGDNRGVQLPRAVALAGDIRDWPSLWFYLNAIDSAITSSGGEVSSVEDLGPGGRDFSLYSPTPASDKVLLSTLDGKPYFVSAANGGLKHASLDANAQIGVFGAVVRLTSTLAAANADGFVYSGHASDNSGVLRLGAISGTFSNEIVTSITSGSGGYSYGHASQSWAADTPHLIVCYWDPITATAQLRIDGVAIGTMTAVSSVVTYLHAIAKGADIMLLRGQASTNRLLGGLGAVFAAGPCSFSAVAAMETQLMTQWGIS